MKFVTEILHKLGMKKASHKTLGRYKEELLSQVGREQFQKLMRFGLHIPVQAL